MLKRRLFVLSLSIVGIVGCSRQPASPSTPKETVTAAGEVGSRLPGFTVEDLQKFGGIAGLPTTMLYDRQGILRAKVIGFEYTDTIEADLKPLF